MKPKFATYDTRVDDLFGLSSALNKRIAVYDLIAGDPVAVFHEVMHYLIDIRDSSARKGLIEAKIVTLQGKTAIALKGRRSFDDKLKDIAIIELSADTMRFIAEENWESGWEKDEHYVLRVLQREIFGTSDAGLTKRISNIRSPRKADDIFAPVDETTKRYCELEIDRFVCRYGRLPDSDPVARYIRKVFDSAFGKDAANYGIVVLPGWDEVFAAILPDGTIMISAGLIKHVQFREELEGVLAHEVIHFKRRHSEAREGVLRETEGRGFVGRNLSMLGLLRTQEQEADLRWMFEEVEGYNINPLGLAMFFNKLGWDMERLWDREGAVESPTHGSSKDRALTMETLFHLRDFARLSHDLHAIPMKVRDYIANSERFDLVDVLHPGLSKGTEKDMVDKFEDDRLEATGDIHPRYLGMVLAVLFRELGYVPGTNEAFFRQMREYEREASEDQLFLEDPTFTDEAESYQLEEGGIVPFGRSVSDYEDIAYDDSPYEEDEEDGLGQTGISVEDYSDKKHLSVSLEMFNYLLSIIDRKLFDRSIWTDLGKRSIARELYLYLWGGIPFLFPSHSSISTLESDMKKLYDIFEEDLRYVSSVGDLNLIIEVLKDPVFLSQDLPFIQGDAISGLLDNIAALYFRLNAMDDFEKIDEDVLAYGAFSRSLADALSELVSIKVADIYTRELILDKMRSALESTLKERINILKPDTFQSLAAMGIRIEVRLTPSRPEESDVERREKWLKSKSASLSDMIASHGQGRQDRYDPTIYMNQSLQDLFSDCNANDIAEIFCRAAKNPKFPPDQEGIRDELMRESPEGRWEPDAPDEEWEKLYADTTEEMAKIWAERSAAKIYNYQLGRLFIDVVRTSDQFRGLGESYRDAIAFGGLVNITYRGGYNDPYNGWNVEPTLKLGTTQARDFVLLEYGNAREPGDYFTKTVEDPRGSKEVKLISNDDRAWLDARLSSIEAKWLGKAWSREDILNIYKGFHLSMTSRPDSIIKPRLLDQIFVKILAAYLAKFGSWQTFFTEVESMEEAGLPVSDIIKYDPVAFGLTLSSLWESLPENPDGAQLRQIMKSADFTADPYLRQALTSYYYENIWPGLTFDRKLDEIFSESGRRYINLTMLNDFIEKECQTEDQIRALLMRGEDGLNYLLQHGSREVGVASILNELSMGARQNRELTEA
ncbi:MAG: M48 family metalloprotease, partial [Candidatus Omnitrophica bacterium]|nr:M48 family metalloprotease [Candidatus Omnitrophota bacterium]